MDWHHEALRLGGGLLATEGGGGGEALDDDGVATVGGGGLAPTTAADDGREGATAVGQNDQPEEVFSVAPLMSQWLSATEAERRQVLAAFSTNSTVTTLHLANANV